MYNLHTLRPKYPTKVHVWAGISAKGRTGIFFFEDIMKKELFVLPFVEDVYPSGHKFMQDNDPKHTSGYAKQWMTENGIDWRKTPAESPEMKPKTKDKLVAGIIEFWSKVDRNKGHGRRVILKVIELNGAATGY